MGRSRASLWVHRTREKEKERKYQASDIITLQKDRSGHWGRKNINFLCGPLKAEKYCYIMGEKDCYDLDRYSIVKQATWWYLVKWKAGDEFIVQYLGEKVMNVGDKDVISSISMTLRKKGIAIHGDIVFRITWIGHVQRTLH